VTHTIHVCPESDRECSSYPDQRCGSCALNKQPAVPEGYALVPIEPTGLMQAAGADAIRFDTTALNRIHMANRAYKAMLSAAKEPK
jgi:hypothetical protein